MHVDGSLVQPVERGVAGGQPEGRTDAVENVKTLVPIRSACQDGDAAVAQVRRIHEIRAPESGAVERGEILPGNDLAGGVATLLRL